MHNSFVTHWARIVAVLCSIVLVTLLLAGRELELSPLSGIGVMAPAFAVGLFRRNLERALGNDLLALVPRDCGVPILCGCLLLTLSPVTAFGAALLYAGAQCVGDLAAWFAFRDPSRGGRSRATTAVPAVRFDWLTSSLDHAAGCGGDASKSAHGCAVVGGRRGRRRRDRNLWCRLTLGGRHSDPKGIAGQAFAPIVAADVSDIGSRRLTAIYVFSAIFSFAPAMIAGVFLFFFDELLVRLFGPSFREGLPLLQIMVVGFLVEAALGPADMFLRMRDRARRGAQLATVGLLLQAIGVLVGYRAVGLTGAAVASSGSVALLALLHLRPLAGILGFGRHPS